jgi:hypothetical protein
MQRLCEVLVVNREKSSREGVEARRNTNYRRSRVFDFKPLRIRKITSLNVNLGVSVKEIFCMLSGGQFLILVTDTFLCRFLD